MAVGLPTCPIFSRLKIMCGALLLVGLFTRWAALLLLVEFTVAIVTTKIPILISKGFWPMEAEARTDFAVLTGLACLLIAGSGRWSLDTRSMENSMENSNER